jgi:hypothetical protein
MKVMNMLITLLLIVIIGYTLYIYTCEAANYERFENPEDDIMSVYGYNPVNPAKLKVKTHPTLMIDGKPFAFVNFEDFEEMVKTDAHPIYNMVGKTDKGVTSAKSEIFTTGKGRKTVGSGFIPVKIGDGLYHITKINKQNKKYYLLADVGEARNGRAVSWYDFVDEERMKKEIERDSTRWSNKFRITEEGIEVEGSNGPSGWTIALNNQANIVMNSKEQGNKSLTPVELVQVEDGALHLVTLQDELYLVNVSRFRNARDATFSQHVMASEKIELGEGMSLYEFMKQNSLHSQPPYTLTNDTYPYAMVYVSKGQVGFINIRQDENNVIDDLAMVPKKYQDSLKELYDKREELEKKVLFQEESEEAGGEVDREESGEVEAELVSEMKVTKESPPGFEGIYISGGVASSFFENAFGSGNAGGALGSGNAGGSGSPFMSRGLEQRVLLNPATDTAKLYNQRKIREHQEYNDGTCEYQLTQPQTCNQYDNPCPKPRHSCYGCGKSPCGCRNKELREKYYKPYMG